MIEALVGAAAKAAETVAKVGEVAKDVGKEMFDPRKALDSAGVDFKDMKNGRIDAFDPKKPLDIVAETENKVKGGGSYREVKKYADGEKQEVHHVPAKSSYELSSLSFEDGPAIKMDKADHRKTASCGNSREAREYCAKQKEYIDEGKFREALQMDIDDIREKFGDKYEKEISEMLEYVDTLEKEGKI
ncbi:MAG: hypothetical protein IJL67_07465 [Oscillospiraceae bacterium]|nr:hypothetical protein [Oscillospiraceae bacterium]